MDERLEKLEQLEKLRQLANVEYRLNTVELKLSELEGNIKLLTSALDFLSVELQRQAFDIAEQAKK